MYVAGVAAVASRGVQLLLTEGSRQAAKFIVVEALKETGRSVIEKWSANASRSLDLSPEQVALFEVADVLVRATVRMNGGLGRNRNTKVNVVRQGGRRGRGGKPTKPKRIVVSRKKHPQSARHLEDAGATGRPLTVDRGGAAARRKAALKGTKPKPGLDRDEVPPAVFKEGGKGASVRGIDPSDNRGSGSSIGHQIRDVPDGGQVIIDVVE